MRILRSIVPLAVLLLAAPAAAQPNAPAILHGAIDRLAADVTEVEDYTFTLVQGELRIPVYVHRVGQSWRVGLPEAETSDLARMAVFWPNLLDPSVSLGLEDAVYLRQETVEDRPAHVIDAALGADRASVDSVRVLVDERTQRVVRLAIFTPVPGDADGGAFGAGAGMAIVLDAGGDGGTAGLPLPAWVRVRMRVDLPGLEAEQRAAMLKQFRQMQAQMRDSDEPRAREMLTMVNLYVQLLSPGGMDVRMQVEDVAVNPGRPGWFTGENDGG